jgi:hypothetical protein
MISVSSRFLQWNSRKHFIVWTWQFFCFCFIFMDIIWLWSGPHVSSTYFLLHSQTFHSSITFICIVTCTTIARQRVRKHVPAKANALNNRTSTARQRSCNHASLTIENSVSVGSLQKSYLEDNRCYKFSYESFTWVPKFRGDWTRNDKKTS